MDWSPIILGILNITDDSFSDGGRYLAPEAAIAHAKTLVAGGATVLDLGAAASNPDARQIPPETEIARLKPVVAALKQQDVAISVDSFSPEVQRWALAEGVGYVNDIHGFQEPALYPALAATQAKLIAMHSVQRRGRATRVDVPPDEIFDRILRFFEGRVAALEEAGVGRCRIILDPGMGFFLGSDREASFVVLRRLKDLKQAFGLPVLISVSRKSFLRTITGRDAANAGYATLAAELFAVFQGADYIRTHDPAALSDGLAIWKAATSRNTA
ncbi:MAG: dihydropteroate synthase [Alphaproteobacteria bacterium]|nr:dihydropteroate synthase [Alphaproteobacteria bacterium]MDE1987922.1 dihydropteroate synthase [Alphaproteobacteria bacterium]MDE2162511.1 dihydropteroate synthase [Alphaproteobacteria bacterium]MDE2264854.1 dihydropteroate synthase [Alphaproteobacteria bacterium]MDE2500484.1 dihydropteroate synthase [Alphaproteobacteria bacterium]